MIIRNVTDIETDRKVDCPDGGFQSIRLLLESDQMGFTLTRTYIYAGKPHVWHYKHHLEACFCIQGKGLVKDLTTGESYPIAPGVMYALDKNEPHEFQAIEDVILICVFNPPLAGKEVHGTDRSYAPNPIKNNGSERSA